MNGDIFGIVPGYLRPIRFHCPSVDERNLVLQIGPRTARYQAIFLESNFASLEEPSDGQNLQRISREESFEFVPVIPAAQLEHLNTSAW
jgi:hypothetical protein